MLKHAFGAKNKSVILGRGIFKFIMILNKIELKTLWDYSCYNLFYVIHIKEKGIETYMISMHLEKVYDNVGIGGVELDDKRRTLQITSQYRWTLVAIWKEIDTNEKLKHKH